MNKKTFKIVIVIVISALVLVGLYFLLKHFFSKEEVYEGYLKNYNVNEYIPTYVSDEDMAKIYLNDYIYIMHSDINKAYDMLDEKYRKEKFGSLENYQNYVLSQTYSTYNLEKYYKTIKNGYIVFGVYDTNGNFYAFKTDGVLQYTVYLDDYTVEIG